MPLKIASIKTENMKNLVITLSKEVRYVHWKLLIRKTTKLMKEIKELNREILQVHKQEDSILSRCQFFPTWSIQFNSNQNARKLFCGYLQTDSEVHMQRQKTPNSQLNIEGEEESWRTNVTWWLDLSHSYYKDNSVLVKE